MASGALPPAFPPIEINSEQYWDGGLYSNTPLQYMVDYYPRRSRLTFQVDLFPAYGSVPNNLDEANEREKDVRYSSRTRLTTDMLREKHDVRHAINELHKLLPPEIADTEQAKRLFEVRLRDRDGHRATHLSSDGAPRRIKGFPVQPRDYGGAMAARVFRCADHVKGIALARTNAKRAWGARVRRDT
jgi:predicted acylesterase/phospholipase RssA